MKRLAWMLAALLWLIGCASIPAYAQGIALRLNPAEALPGSTVYLETEAMANTSTLGLSFNASLVEATTLGGRSPAFTNDLSVETLAKNGLIQGALQPDGSYNIGLAFSVPVKGPGKLFRIPIKVPNGAQPRSVYQLILKSASAVGGDLGASLPISILSGTLLIQSPSGMDSSLLSVGSATGRGGAAISLSVALGNVTGVGAVDLTLDLGGANGPLKATLGSPQPTSLTQNSLVEVHRNADGQIVVAVADANGINGPGELLRLPLILDAATPPGDYAINLSSAQLSRTSGQPITTTSRGGVLTVLSGGTSAPVSLQFQHPVMAVPVGSPYRFLIQARDVTGQVSWNPSASLTSEGRSGRATLVGYVFQPPAPGAYLLQAQSSNASAQALVDAFTPPSNANLIVPDVYGHPGDRVWMPIYLKAASPSSNVTFDLTLDGTGDLPTLDGQPVLYSELDDLQGVTYSQPTGTGAYRVWTRGLSADSVPSLTWLLPIRLPATISFPVTTYRIRLAPTAGSDSGSVKQGSEAVIHVVSTASPSVQVAAPVQERLYKNKIPVRVTSPSDSAGVLFGKAWVEGKESGAVYLDALHPSAEISAAGLSEGSAVVHFQVWDHLGTLQEQRIPVEIGKASSEPILGDLNDDQKINVQDATLSLKIVVGVLQPTPEQQIADDVNQDGKLNVQDTTQILRMAVGLGR